MSSSSTAILPNIISSNRLNSVLYVGVGDAGCMTNNRRLVFAALIAAGVLWGTTVPLSKLALVWLGPAWLAFARFGVAAAVLLLGAGGGKVRAAVRPYWPAARWATAARCCCSTSASAAPASPTLR